MSDMQPDRPIDLGDLAAEPPEESTQAELDAVGDAADTGDVTQSDSAQHAPDTDTDTAPKDPPTGLMSARLPFGADPV